MTITKLDIESRILGFEVYRIDEITDGNDFLSSESEIRTKYNPFYIQCQIDAGDLGLIHSMEEAGFRYVEFRLKKMLDINAYHSVDQLAFYPYILKSIRDEENLEKAKEILRKSEFDDRFSRDPDIDAKLSKDRLLGYLDKSYENRESEFIYGLFNKNTDELLAYKTIQFINKDQILFSQTAIRENIEIKRFTFILDNLIISEHLSRGVQHFYSVTSAFNLMELDLHVSDLKYKNISSSVILRKIYH